MGFGARQVCLNISETVDLLGSHTTVYAQKKTKPIQGVSFAGGNALFMREIRGQTGSW